ncbi:MAG: SulP family inorganic anion transporter [Fusobacterium sp. JB021]|nr:SulP family inorganic anion transporter [Fusobacterium sp. JB021]MDP0505663.1 SulP family inorganic anion transporter [Fusobacterium sp. JB019]
MISYTPKLFKVLKTYSKEQFMSDFIAGVIVAIIALPLSIALALASGVGPKEGLYTAIVAGFVIATFGGSRVQVSGPTAAFATIVAGIVATKGMEGLVVATILAGIILILMGVFKMGALIKYIPYTIVTGFTAGIAITILIGQIKDFLGLTFNKAPIESLDKIYEVIINLNTIKTESLIIGTASLIILIFWPKINERIPGSLIAVVITSVAVKILGLNVNTIGSLYNVSASLPSFNFPVVNINIITELLPSAFTIAILASIESLLSCVVSDGMIGGKHDSNSELIGQGLGNIASGLFGGIPATGAIARTAANVKNGGRSPIAAMVHAVVLLLVLIVLMPYAALIPMPTIAAILFMVAYNMSGWRECLGILKRAPKSDIAVFVITFLLTIIFDLVIAIEVGLIVSSLLFMKRMVDETKVRRWTETEMDTENLREIPKDILVYEIEGPMFFAAAETFLSILPDKNTRVIIIRMRSVGAIDVSVMKVIKGFIKKCEEDNIKIIISNIQSQPYKALLKAGYVQKIGEDNFVPNIHVALERAKNLK